MVDSKSPPVGRPNAIPTVTTSAMATNHRHHAGFGFMRPAGQKPRMMPRMTPPPINNPFIEYLFLPDEIEEEEADEHERSRIESEQQEIVAHRGERHAGHRAAKQIDAEDDEREDDRKTDYRI